MLLREFASLETQSLADANQAIIFSINFFIAYVIKAIHVMLENN
jgi:hypothetical protein